MSTSFSLFAGGGLADIGLHQAGYTSIGGIDNDPAVVDVAQTNGLPFVCRDILTADPRGYERPDLLWISPPCTTASVANQRTGETAQDRALAQACCRFIAAMCPHMVVLENVPGYRQYQAYAAIVTTLQHHGYHVRDWLLNAADYGVPQQRRRLILIAARAFVPQRPPATHRRHADMFSPAWRGWYPALADLIPTLPPSRLAPWQQRRLPACIPATVLIGSASVNLVINPMTSPAATVRDYAHSSIPRILLVDDQFSSAGGLRANDRGPTMAPGDQPAFTVTTRDCRKIRTVCLTDADVRSLTPRALARLQDVPDSYQLPDNRTLACSLIGRGVPCTLAAAIGACHEAIA